MKSKAEEIKKNPANLDIKLRNRIENGNKLIADLKTGTQSPGKSQKQLSWQFGLQLGILGISCKMVHETSICSTPTFRPFQTYI